GRLGKGAGAALGNGVSLRRGRLGQAARRARASHTALRGRGLHGDLRAPLAASARARARRHDPRALPRALRRGALPGRVRAREPAHRLRAHRSAAREPDAGRGRRMVAPLEAGVAGGRGLRILLVTGALGLAVAGGLLALARPGPTLAPDLLVPPPAGRPRPLSGPRGPVVAPD